MEHAFKHQIDGWEEREDSWEGKYGEAEKRAPEKLRYFKCTGRKQDPGQMKGLVSKH